jgi:hypothetical protein
MKGSDIDTIAGALLVDPNAVTWKAADRLRWINMGVREIATLKPKASTVSAAIQITAGLTRQEVPADVITVLDLTANMGADGLTPGRAISTVAADRLAAAVPTWRTDKGAAVRHLVIDDRDPGAFYVWPAITSGTWYVEGLLHKHPVAITALGDTLPLNDSYLNALVEYVLHMAYAQDGENPGHAELSVAHYTKFAQTLGVQIQKQKKASPSANSAEAPGYPVVDKNAAP